MTFTQACQEVFVPLCREFATHELSLGALDKFSRARSIIIDVGKNGERGELTLQEQKGKGPYLSFRVPVGSPPTSSLWEITLSQPSRFSLPLLSQGADLGWHWVTLRAALCHRILGRALELAAGAEAVLAKAEEEEPTEVDDGVTGEGFLGPDGHTIAFNM